MSPVARLAGALLGLTLAAPTAAHAGSRQPVEVGVVGVDSVTVGLGRTEVVLVAEVTRVRGLPVHLRWLDHRISVGDVVVSERRTDLNSTRLARGQSAEVRIPFSFDTAVTAGALLGALTTGRMDIAIDGRAGVRVLVVPLAFGFEGALTDLGR